MLLFIKLHPVGGCLPKKKEKWSATFGLHSNVFFVPNKDREFVRFKIPIFNFLKFKVQHQQLFQPH
jgi:hypothetical protein